MRLLRYLSLGIAMALAIGFAPDAGARSEYYAANCSGCHGATPTTCNGCHKHGAGNVSGTIDRTSFAPGETMTFTVTAGTRTGWWRAAVLDQSNAVVKTVSVASGITATITAPAPSAAGTYAWRVAWYGNERGRTSTTNWVAASNPSHGYQTAAVAAFTVTAASAPAIALAPTSLSFGSVTVGAPASQTAQVRNTGTAPLTVSAIGRCASPATSAEFTWSPTALPLTIAAGGSANLTVTYSPTAAGTDSGCIALTSNASNGPTTNLAVSGTGVVPAAPKIAVSPTSLAFGNVTVGSSSPRTFTISNTGTATLTGTVSRAAGTSAEFTVSPASFSVAAGGSQVVTVTYAPTSVASDSGGVTVASNDASSPTVSVAVSGAGVEAPAPNIALAPASLPFGTVTVGGSASLTAQIRNTGTAPLAVSQIARCASPATSAEFTWSPAAPFTVAEGGSTTVTVTYTPAGAGADAGCLAISSNDASEPVVSLDVSGTGQLPAAPKIAVSPIALSFGNVTVGTASSRTFTVSNTGNATLTGTVARAAGTSTEYAPSPASFNVAVGASQVVTVSYTPTGTGTDGGSILVTSNDSSAPSLSVGLSGSGVPAPTPAIAVAPSSLTFGSVVLGGSASLTAQVRNDGTATLNVTGIALCPGTSAEFGWAPVAPFPVAPGQSAAVTVTYRPTATGTDSGCLAVSSNDPASPTVNLGLSGTGAAQAIPAIALSTSAIDFGTVSVGGSSSQTVEVRNTGNGALEVTGISRCSGTPSAFTWSPAAPFTVAAGESASLTATYSPTAAADDSGCLTLASNDPASPAVELGLAGVAAQTPVPSVDADIDIVELKIPGRAKSPERPLRPRATLVNRSAVAGTATATLVGVLDGVQVYEEALSITLPAGSSQVLEFPPYAPSVGRGTILWTLTVEDRDPDTDEATARSVVHYRQGFLASFITGDPEAEGKATGGCSSGAGSASLATLLALALVARRRPRFAARR